MKCAKERATINQIQSIAEERLQKVHKAPIASKNFNDTFYLYLNEFLFRFIFFGKRISDAFSYYFTN